MVALLSRAAALSGAALLDLPRPADALSQVRYNAWRTYDPLDTVRFHAVRLHDLGMIRSTPQNIIAEGTDLRFLNELKRELKA